jgi:uncharacterized protein
MLDLPSDLDRLDEFLLALGDDVMMLSEPDGFLTGILVCPVMLVPGIWHRYVWGPEGPHSEASFEWADEARDVALSVMGHYDTIACSQSHPPGAARRSSRKMGGQTTSLEYSGLPVSKGP